MIFRIGAIESDELFPWSGLMSECVIISQQIEEEMPVSNTYLRYSRW